MCGRYTSTSAPSDLAQLFEVDDVRVDELPVRYNVAPTQEVYSVAARRPRTPGEPVRRQLGAFRWGLVPSWAKDPSVGSRMINARAEGLESRSAFKAAFARRRCIIPADAFYEWQVRETMGGKKSKLPYLIRHRDGSPMAFAGLWEYWRPPGDAAGQPIRSCVIVTSPANDYLMPIHDRMPVVLPPAAWNRWLDPLVVDVARVRSLLVPAPSSHFDAFPVGTLVNDVAHEGPDLVRPLHPPPGAV